MSNKELSIPTDRKSLKRLIDRRHPEYDAKTKHWHFLNETYLGTREWFRQNIFQFTREGAETYKSRLDRAYRFNHTREVVDLVNKYLFKNQARRSEDVPHALKRFRENATLSGLDLREFERQVSRKASIFGRIHVVVDNDYDRNGGLPTTVAEEKEMGGQLYAYIVQPDDFLDCGYDKGGQYSWVLLREKVRADDDPFKSSGETVPNFRLWTRTYWALFGYNARNQIELIDAQLHDLGIVPVIKCDHVESDNKYSVPALIEDIAYLDRAAANYLSNLDQIINEQTFSQLIMPAQGVLSGMPNASDSDPHDPNHELRRKRMVSLGTSQILLYDGEHGGEPKYIAPDPRQAGVIVEMVHKIINEIYHTVGLAGERTKSDNSLGIDNASGVAKAFDFERVNALLSAKASAMESFSNELESVVRIYAGEDVETALNQDETVVYPMNFDVRNLVQDLSIAQEMSLLSAPIEIRRLLMKNIVEKMWPMINSDDKKMLDSAIDKWDDSLNNSLITDLVASDTDSKNAYNPGLSDIGKTPGQGAVGGRESASKVTQ